MKTVGVINGANMDRLGKREVGVYGEGTLAELEGLLEEEAKRLEARVVCFHSNHEGVLIDKIGKWTDEGFDGIIINPGGYTHTSVALLDAIGGSNLPFIEVHISNIFGREAFRQQSLIASQCKGVIAGLGFGGYVAALRDLVRG